MSCWKATFVTFPQRINFAFGKGEIRMRIDAHACCPPFDAVTAVILRVQATVPIFSRNEARFAPERRRGKPLA